MQYFRTELKALAESDTAEMGSDEEARWQRLRAEMRKAYNQVALFGAAEARSIGREIWRTGRSGGNSVMRMLRHASTGTADRVELSEGVTSTASQLGVLGEQFLDACRRDLEAGVDWAEIAPE